MGTHLQDPTVHQSVMTQHKNSINSMYLCDYHNIRSDTTIFNVEVLPSPTKPALYFIHNKENAIFVADVTQAL